VGLQWSCRRSFTWNQSILPGTQLNRQQVLWTYSRSCQHVWHYKGDFTCWLSKRSSDLWPTSRMGKEEWHYGRSQRNTQGQRPAGFSSYLAVPQATVFMWVLRPQMYSTAQCVAHAILEAVYSVGWHRREGGNDRTGPNEIIETQAPRCLQPIKERAEDPHLASTCSCSPKRSTLLISPNHNPQECPCIY
jgi:hypothetical protein